MTHHLPQIPADCPLAPTKDQRHEVNLMHRNHVSTTNSLKTLHATTNYRSHGTGTNRHYAVAPKRRSQNPNPLKCRLQLVKIIQRCDRRRSGIRSQRQQHQTRSRKKISKLSREKVSTNLGVQAKTKLRDATGQRVSRARGAQYA